MMRWFWRWLGRGDKSLKVNGRQLKKLKRQELDLCMAMAAKQRQREALWQQYGQAAGGGEACASQQKVLAGQLMTQDQALSTMQRRLTLLGKNIRAQEGMLRFTQESDFRQQMQQQSVLAHMEPEVLEQRIQEERIEARMLSDQLSEIHHHLSQEEPALQEDEPLQDYQQQLEQARQQEAASSVDLPCAKPSPALKNTTNAKPITGHMALMQYL